VSKPEPGKLTSEAMRRAQDEFRRALDSASLPYRMGQLELLAEDEEQFIQREVERKLHKPKLPNAGARERMWLDKLKAFARDDSLVVTLKAAAGRYARSLEALLPRQEYIRQAEGEEDDSRWLTLPGCYYTTKPVTPKTNKSLFTAATDLRKESERDSDKKWLAEFLLAGEPEQVSNFKMECLYLLRGSDGNVTRLVRLVNILGEKSQGPETGKTHILPSEEFGSAEKFRVWCQRLGNFCWGVGESAGNLELQKLHSDVSHTSAYKVARLIEYCGWLPLKGSRDVVLRGIWFCDECAFASDGELLIPDEDGVIQYDGDIYVLARKGREADFAHGRPAMKPNETITEGESWLKAMESVSVVELNKSDWQEDSLLMPTLSGFFREMCHRFFDTAGGMGGWMAIGSMLGYAAGPEFFEFYGCLPAIFIPGQMGSGKTFFTNWLMGMQGYGPTKGLGLGKGSRVTPVGLCQQLENYSCMAIWFDEYRQYEITDEKVTIIRDSYDRQLAGKWTPDGIQRLIRTTPVISGETDTSDAATRSRYTHLQLSATERLGNHVNWMRDNRRYFYFFWRHIMANRPQFVETVMRLAADWFADDETKNIPERSRVTHSLAYAAFCAATLIFESHSPDELREYKKFIISRSSSAAEDVSSDVNVNVFMQDLVTAFKHGEIPPEFFRVEKTLVQHPPDAPNQGSWESCKLYMDPNSVISALQMFLRKGGQAVTLRYKDLRDQLSKNKYWIHPEPGKSMAMRIGKRGDKGTVKAWGFHIDLHPMGYQRVSDEELTAAKAEILPGFPSEIGVMFKDGDPRKGELFAIITGVTAFEDKERRDANEQQRNS
jgi:hypothetical protein